MAPRNRLFHISAARVRQCAAINDIADDMQAVLVDLRYGLAVNDEGDRAFILILDNLDAWLRRRFRFRTQRGRRQAQRNGKKGAKKQAR